VIKIQHGPEEEEEEEERRWHEVTDETTGYCKELRW
jgi:hypothetical protein